MDNELNLHATYMALTFRPLIRADGSVGRVGVLASGPACVDPEVYPNLITAAPALYQALALLKDRLHSARDAEVIESVEMVLAFAQNGYLGGIDVSNMIRGLQK